MNENSAADSPAAAEPSSVSGFAALNLNGAVLQALADVGYEMPTPIQAATIPPLLGGADLLGQAQTGTGKTAAFALPVLSKIDVGRAQPQALVLVPTRELAIQVAEAFQKYAAHMPRFHVLPIYGGQSYTPQIKGLKRGAHVIVGTPGRVMDHMKRGTLDLTGLNFLVLDEADEMLQMGFIDDIEWIREQAPANRQVALFSATLPPPIRRIAQKHLRSPVEITIKTKTTTSANIRQRYWLVSGLHKLDALTRILEAEDFDGMLIFVRTKLETVDLAERLQARGFDAAALNGDIHQQQRERTVNALKAGEVDIVVATDVAARGLDVERVSHVVNYDVPYDSESYVHRIGRTGRAGRKGEAILFIAPRERNMLRIIERATRQPIEQMRLPSVAAVNEQRVARFKQRITEAVDSGEGAAYRELVEQFESERNIPAIEIAAALASLAQGGTPLLLPEKTDEWGAGVESGGQRRGRDDSRRPDRFEGRGDRHDRRDGRFEGGGEGRGDRPPRREQEPRFEARDERPVRPERGDRSEARSFEGRGERSGRHEESDRVAARPPLPHREGGSERFEGPPARAGNEHGGTSEDVPGQDGAAGFEAREDQLVRPEGVEGSEVRAGSEHVGTGEGVSGQDGAPGFEASEDQPVRPEPARHERDDRFEGREAPRKKRGPNNIAFETFRIEVGHVHGVKPGNIVGAIANEAGLEGRHIGHVDIHEDHSFVDLPEGMPKEIFRSLKKVVVLGQELQMTYASGKPNGGGRGRGGRAGRPEHAGAEEPAEQGSQEESVGEGESAGPDEHGGSQEGGATEGRGRSEGRGNFESRGGFEGRARFEGGQGERPRHHSGPGGGSGRGGGFGRKFQGGPGGGPRRESGGYSSDRPAREGGGFGEQRGFQHRGDGPRGYSGGGSRSGPGGYAGGGSRSGPGGYSGGGSRSGPGGYAGGGSRSGSGGYAGGGGRSGPGGYTGGGGRSGSGGYTGGGGRSGPGNGGPRGPGGFKPHGGGPKGKRFSKTPRG